MFGRLLAQAALPSRRHAQLTMLPWSTVGYQHLARPALASIIQQLVPDSSPIIASPTSRFRTLLDAAFQRQVAAEVDHWYPVQGRVGQISATDDLTSTVCLQFDWLLMEGPATAEGAPEAAERATEGEPNPFEEARQAAPEAASVKRHRLLGGRAHRHVSAGQPVSEGQPSSLSGAQPPTPEQPADDSD